MVVVQELADRDALAVVSILKAVITGNPTFVSARFAVSRHVFKIKP